MAEFSISAIVHTRNSGATLEKALASLSWVNEIIVVDMQSTDDTLAIAECYTDQIIQTDFAQRVDGIRNRYIETALNEWILVLDSDEWLASDAQTEINLLLTKHADKYVAFSFPRFNYVGEQLLQGGQWYPDNQVRLFRKGTVNWSDTHHHLPEVNHGRLLELQPPQCLHIHHQNYADLRDFIHRQLNYALTDNYSDSADDFNFSEYVAKAYETMALRTDTEKDGDLSQALALLLAWDSIVRGLIHWDSLQPRPPLNYLPALPVATSRISDWKIRIKIWSRTRYPIWFYLRRIKNRLGRITRFLGRSD